MWEHHTATREWIYRRWIWNETVVWMYIAMVLSKHVPSSQRERCCAFYSKLWQTHGALPEKKKKIEI